MQVPEAFNLPKAAFNFLPDGKKEPPVFEWQLPENHHTYQEALEHRGNIGFISGRGYIGLDLDNMAVMGGLQLPPTLTWETRPGRLGKLFTGTVPAELMEKHGKPADYSQFKFYKDGKVVGELKFERCYQVIPNSWKTLDPEDGGMRADYRLLDGTPPAAIDAATLLDDILSLPGVSLKKNPKPDTATRPTVALPVEAPYVPMETSGTREHSYANAALLSELAKVEGAPVSTRYDQVYASACALGEFVGAGLLPHDATARSLVEAGTASGLPRHKAIESAKHGMEKGMKNPRKTPKPTTLLPPASLTPHIAPGNPGHNPEGWFDGQFYGVKAEPIVHEMTEEEYNAYRMPEGPKFSINLPPENYISRFMAYGDEISDAYKDFWLAGALMQLAVVSDKKLRVELRQGTIYANVYISINGKSSLARKSTVAQKVEDILIVVRPDLLWQRVPTEFSPEAFTEHMDQNQHAPWIRDEAAGVLALMKRDYMKGFKDCLTSLYDCKPYDRKLRTSQRKSEKTHFSVHDPFLNLFWATTDASFAANTEINDTLSGFLARFAFFFPQGKKLKFMPLQEGNAIISDMETVVIDQLKEIAAKIDSMERTAMHIAPDAAEYWETWQKIREDEAVATNDGVTMQIFSRMNPMVIKLAMLFEMGQPDFDANHPIRREFVVEACRLIDSYLSLTSRAMYDLVGSNVEKNYIDRIMGHLKTREGKATKNDIMKAVKIKSKELTEYLDTMIECHMIRTEIYKAHGKGRDSVLILIDDQAEVSKITTIPTIPKIPKIPENNIECVLDSPAFLDTLVIQDISAPLGHLAPGVVGKGEIKDAEPPVAPVVGPSPIECKDAVQAALSSGTITLKQAAIIPQKGDNPEETLSIRPQTDREKFHAAVKKHTAKQKRTCHICERTFDYDLTPDQSAPALVGCYICTTCLMEHKTKDKVKTEDFIQKTL